MCQKPARQCKDRCSWSDVLGHLPPAGRCSQSLPGLVRPGRGMTKPPAGAEGWLSLSAGTRSQTIPLVGAAGAARGSRSRAHLPGGAHPPADRRRWLCDIVSGLQGHDAYADRAAGCVAGRIKHGHAHTGYMIAAGCCAGPAAAKEETWKAVCLTIPWYQFTTSKGELTCTI